MYQSGSPMEQRYVLPLAVFLILVAAGGFASWYYLWYPGYVITLLVSLFVSTAMKVAAEWERMAVLRAGKFHRMGGPGVFFIVPILDTVPYVIDVRVVPYDVPKQKTLTNDNVPVTVDAIVYYRVADPKQAVFAVDNYKKATQLGAASILRDIIGKSTLDQVLSQRERLSKEIKSQLDGLTSDWGIEVPNVEIRDVVISEQLEDAIAREPAAEREKRARLKLAEAELLAAKTIFDAARVYEEDPVALQLRSMNMVYEMCMEGRSTVIFVPTETKTGMPIPMGVYGLVSKLGDLAGSEAVKPSGAEAGRPGSTPVGSGE